MFDEQYLEAKRRHPNTIILFRMGGHYEAFNDDAECIAECLKRKLIVERGTKRIHLPARYLDKCIDWLNREGFAVTVCRIEQFNEV
jgi:DNA mismatch repair ATPase MutS